MTLWTILVCVLTQSATCYDNVEQAQEVSAQILDAGQVLEFPPSSTRWAKWVHAWHEEGVGNLGCFSSLPPTKGVVP